MEGAAVLHCISLLPLLEEIERIEAAAADPDGFPPSENKDIPESG